MATLNDAQAGQRLPEHGEEALRAEAAAADFSLTPHPVIGRVDGAHPLLLIVLDGLGVSP